MRGALSEPANPAMNPEEELNLRRDVRATVFRLARAHREAAPGMSLAGEFAAVQARLAALGCPDPARTLYIGDSIHDLHSGRGAGVLTGAVLWGPFSRVELEPATPDYWFERPEQLRKLLLPK